MAAVLEGLSTHYIPILILSDHYFAFGACQLLAAIADDVRTEFQTLDEQKEIKNTIRKIIEMQSIIKQSSKCKKL